MHASKRRREKALRSAGTKQVQQSCDAGAALTCGCRYLAEPEPDAVAVAVAGASSTTSVVVIRLSSPVV